MDGVYTEKQQGTRQAPRRTTYIVDAVSQYRMVRSLILMGIVISGTFGAGRFFFFKRVRELLLSQGLPPDHVYFDLVADQEKVLWMFHLGATVVALALLAVAGVLLSHRVVGPVVRLRKLLQASEAANWNGKFRFRENDFFKSLADAFNSVIGVASKASSHNRGKGA